PRFPIPRQRELRFTPLRFEPAAHKDVRTADNPADVCGRSGFRDQLAVLHYDPRGRQGALAPEFPGKVRPIFPQAVADGFRIPWLLSVMLHRAGVPPAPGDRLAGPQHHVHTRALDGIAIARGGSFEHEDARLPLIGRTLVRVENTLRVRAPDQI